MIAMVLARSTNGVIGNTDAIPWRLRADLVHLKQLTANQFVIIGRKSYQSMDGYYSVSGRPMPGKLYIVISRDKSFETARENATVASSVEQAFQIANFKGKGDVYVIGGAQIYQACLPLTDTVFLTEVDAIIEGDTTLPAFDLADWQEVNRQHHPKDEANDYDFDWVTLKRN